MIHFLKYHNHTSFTGRKLKLTKCMKEKLKSKMLKVGRNPKCDENGDYEEFQRFRGGNKYHCVDKETGDVLEGFDPESAEDCENKGM